MLLKKYLDALTLLASRKELLGLLITDPHSVSSLIPNLETFLLRDIHFQKSADQNELLFDSLTVLGLEDLDFILLPFSLFDQLQYREENVLHLMVAGALFFLPLVLFELVLLDFFAFSGFGLVDLERRTLLAFFEVLWSDNVESIQFSVR